MSDKAADPVIEPVAPGSEVRTVLTGLLGVPVFLVGGVILTKTLHEALGVFDWLTASDVYFGPFFIVGHIIVALPLLAVRTRSWRHRTGFLAASVPFAVYYATAGIAAGLIRFHLPWGPPLTVSSVALIALSAPMVILHMHLFDRPVAPATGAIAKREPWGTRNAIRFAVLMLPGLLLLAASIDLVDATGAASGFREIDWTVITLFALLSGTTFFSGRDRSRRMLVIAAMIAGTMVGAAMLTLGAMLFGTLVSSDYGPAIANTLFPLLVFILIHWVRGLPWSNPQTDKPRKT